MNIKSKLIIFFLIISLVPLLIFGVFNYINAEKLLKKQILRELEIVADLKEKNFQDLFDHNIEKLKLVSSRYQLKVELDKYNNNVDNKNESQRIISQIINPIKPAIERFEDIMILDPFGKVVASTNNAYVGTSHINDQFFIDAKNQKNVSILFKDKDNKLKSYLAGPLIHNNKFLGVATIIYNLGDFISMLKAFERLTSTGEIMLVKKDDNGNALILNPLRFYPEASLNLTVSKNQTHTPTIQSLLNNENSFTETTDYRGVSVLAVTRYIEKLDWGLVVKIDKTEALASLENLKYVTILIGVLVGISIIVASFILGNSISNPIQKLRNVMKDVTKGKFDSKIDVKGTDEIEELANQLDIMRLTISNTNTHLNELVKERTEKIEKSIRELKEKEEELKESNRQLVIVNEKLNIQSKVQKEFINISAHELRTPIVPIITLSELLYDKIKNENENELQNTPLKENKKKQEQFLQVILRNAYRLYQLTQDILDVTKIESQILKMNKELIQLNDIIESIVNDYKDNITRKKYDDGYKVRIMYEPIEEPIFVNADKARIIQVLSNLLNNTLKFTKEGNIIISIKKTIEEQQVMLSIKDTGTGIDPEIIPRLFTKFATKSEEGTGLGLFISKSIVEAHGGKIWAENNSDGRGATFYFTLPIGKSWDQKYRVGE
jgi:signal transduction histidine kinase